MQNAQSYNGPLKWFAGGERWVCAPVVTEVKDGLGDVAWTPGMATRGSYGALPVRTDQTECSIMWSLIASVMFVPPLLRFCMHCVVSLTLFLLSGSCSPDWT